MKSYDVIIIGSGCGAIIADEALDRGLKVAMVDKGPLGGTCLNLGCIPSKMLIYPADKIVEIQEAAKLGIVARVERIDFTSIMRRMRQSRAESQAHIREGMTHTPDLDLYEDEAHFTADYTLQMGRTKIKAPRIFITSGSRPVIPAIKGLDSVPFLTSESVLELDTQPESLIIIGGGYVAVEFGHFFAAMGTRVTILEMADRLVLSEEPEISELLKQVLGRRIAIHTGVQVETITATKNGVKVSATSKNAGGPKEFTAEKIMLAVGRRSNADVLKVENTGVATDQRGYITVNEYLETSQKNIYAAGDALGKLMFRQMANVEADVAANNAFNKKKIKVDYRAVPHAIYSHPQIASVGLSEEAARKNHRIVVARSKYFDIAKGEAMLEKEGFAKAIVEHTTGKILGFHIIGPNAPELIQEVVNAMSGEGNTRAIHSNIHIHPALSELIPAAMPTLSEVQG